MPLEYAGALLRARNLNFLFTRAIFMQAFSNLRVIDLTHVIAGPFCTYQLAVMGADVIKVEAPENPDVSRTSGAMPVKKASTESNAEESDMRSDFTAQNANKRTVCIDLKSARGVEILRRLIAGADVFVENYRSGAMAKIGLDYPAVKSLKPDIIYCSITGFGQQGPLAERTAYDNVIQAYSGLMAATGDRHTAPLKVGPPVLDYGTGIQAAFAIAAALYQRTVTGEGQYIDVAMLDAAIMLMSSHVTRFHHTGKLAPATGNNSAFNAGYCCYETKKGLLMLGAYTGAQMKQMWVVLGDSEHGEVLRTLTPMAMADYFEEDQRRIGEILKQETAAHWEIEFNRKRVPAARVRELDQALADPQLGSRTVLQTPPADAAWPSSEKLPVAAFQYAKNGPQLRFPPQPIARHTQEVLEEIGYDEGEITELQNLGVIKIAVADETDETDEECA